jgi:two-component system, NarL family, invasion response regulator UvrY
MKLLIVDDHVVVREGIRRLLATLSEAEVFEAATTRDAIQLYRAQTPDIILLDLNLPNSSGFELLRRLLIEDRHAKIIILSMHAEPIYVSRTMNAGARGYVSKTASAGELITAVREVAAGRRYVERDIAAQMVVSQYGGVNPFEKLTTREIDIVRLLGEGKNFASIAAALGVTHKTVANSCSIIKGKLGVEHTTDLIRLTYQMGDR